MLSDEARGNPGKYLAMFERRARQGQCVNQPYLGCREFAAGFRLVDLVASGASWRAADGEPPAWESWNADLGWMLYGLDYTDRSNPKPQFFRAQVQRGVVDLLGVEVRG